MSRETSSQSMSQAELGVLPSGHLRWFPAKDDSDPGSQTGQAAIEIAFARGVAEGLIALAAKDTAADLPPTPCLLVCLRLPISGGAMSNDTS